MHGLSNEWRHGFGNRAAAALFAVGAIALFATVYILRAAPPAVHNGANDLNRMVPLMGTVVDISKDALTVSVASVAATENRTVGISEQTLIIVRGAPKDQKEFQAEIEAYNAALARGKRADPPAPSDDRPGTRADIMPGMRVIVEVEHPAHKATARTITVLPTALSTARQ